MPNLAISAPARTLTFNAVTMHVHHHDGKTWFSSADIAKALQYSREDSVSAIYTRNQDEFTAEMSQTVKLTVSGNYQKTIRLFSLRGAHLVAMFARTPVAKSFRRWVLDILELEARNRRQGIGPDGWGVCSSAPDAVRKYLSRKEFVINFIDGSDHVDIRLLERRSPYEGLAKAIADPANIGLKDEVILEIGQACVIALANRAKARGDWGETLSRKLREVNK